jgi:hypothetical protein
MGRSKDQMMSLNDTKQAEAKRLQAHIEMQAKLEELREMYERKSDKR